MYKRLRTDALAPALRQGVLVDGQFQIRYWATVWSTLTMSDAAPSSREKKLRFIDDLYVHADCVAGRGALDEALYGVDETQLAFILESWFVSIINRSPGTTTDEARWRTGFDFVSTIATWLSKSPSPGHAVSNVERKLHRLTHMYKQLHVARPHHEGSQFFRRVEPRAGCAASQRASHRMERRFPRRPVRSRASLGTAQSRPERSLGLNLVPQDLSNASGDRGD